MGRGRRKKRTIGNNDRYRDRSTLEALGIDQTSIFYRDYRVEFFFSKILFIIFSAERRSIRGSFSSREEQCFRRTVFFTRSRNRIKEEDVRVYP